MDDTGRTTPASAPKCSWCGKDATRELKLRSGRVTNRKTVLPVLVPVCKAHYEHFTSEDEVGVTTDDPGGW